MKGLTQKPRTPRRFATITVRFWLAVLLTACSTTNVTQPQTAASTTATPLAPSSSAAPTASALPSSPVQRAEPSLPEPREEVATAAFEGKLYIIGGYDASGRDTNTVFVYDGAWSLGPPLPSAVDHPAAAVVGGHLYVAGGFALGQASARTYRLSVDHWEPVASLHHPRAALALVALDNRLYALGGRNTIGNVAVTEVYDPDAGAWTTLSSLPAARHHVAGFAYQGMACVAGGKFPYTARVDCYDPSTLAWHRLPDLPRATSGAGAAVMGADPVVAGGEGNGVIPWLFRLDGGTWHEEPMLLPRHGMQIALLGDRAWACGGGTLPGLHPTSLCTSISDWRP